MPSFEGRDIVIDLGKCDIEEWDRLYCYQMVIVRYADILISIPFDPNMWYRSDPYV